MIGIYCYEDTWRDNEIVYVGKDSNIKRKSRHTAHTSPSRYGEQQINRVLQNNPNRYKYKVLKSWVRNNFHKNLANALEIIYIRRYAPIFNFTVGGQGLSGFKMSQETKNKISLTKKENHDKISRENNPRYHNNVPAPLELLTEYESNNFTQKELAEKYGVSRGTIYYRLHEALKLKEEDKHFTNRRHAPPKLKGKNHPMYNSNIPKPKDLLKEYEEGMDMVQLSKKYDCSTSTIHRRIGKARKMRGLR